MKTRHAFVTLVLLALVFGGCRMSTAPSASHASRAYRAERSDAKLFAAAGDIAPTVNAFRDALGTLNPNAPGSFGDGRREINWDAVPAAFTNTDDFPGGFFNQPVVGRARGTVFTTSGTGFRTSDNNFSDLSADFGRQFEFFSPIRTFAPVGSSSMAVTFFVPGSDTGAVSTGFGVVFSDVDHPGSASIRLFDASGRSLGRYIAPAAPGGLSFVGITFRNALVARVEIESGQAAVAPGAVDRDPRKQGPGRDLVIMDDFIYGEPRAIALPTRTTADRIAVR